MGDDTVLNRQLALDHIWQVGITILRASFQTRTYFGCYD